jgi:AraC-like DNA-binding protein
MRAKVKYWLAPGMRSVELIAADYLGQRFSPHWHLGFAVGVVTRNTQQFSSQGRNWTIGRGDLILLNPGQVHNGWSLHSEGWSSRMAYIPESTLVSLLGSGADHERLQARFPLSVMHAPNLAEKFLAWHCGTEVGAAGYGPAMAEKVFGELLGLTRVGSVGGDPSLAFSERLRQISDGFEPVPELSGAQHASRSTSWRQMRALFGIGRQTLVRQVQLITAKRQLASGRPVLQTALEAGYHDQSHFTRHFAAAYGMTPARFRRGQSSVDGRA